MTVLINSAPEDSAAMKKQVEAWFNDGMDRVSGWYKRNAQQNALLLACAVTLVFNADTLKVVHVLWTNPTVRAAVVEEARVRAAKQPPTESLQMVEYANADDATESTPRNIQNPLQGISDTEQQLLGEVTGWQEDRSALMKAGFGGAALLGVIGGHLPGWILTAIAVSLGAPFWFDTLNRFMNIRNAGRSSNEPRDKSSSAATPAN